MPPADVYGGTSTSCSESDNSDRFDLHFDKSYLNEAEVKETVNAVHVYECMQELLDNVVSVVPDPPKTSKRKRPVKQTATSETVKIQSQVASPVRGREKAVNCP
jgi:glycine cleavage system H lipoate-binding protein